MDPNPIFISYRRDDAAGYARAVYDALALRFGADRVFMDVDDIHPGEAFADVIRREVGGSTLLLVLIGRRWLGERTGQPARITEVGDFVRIEVAAALARGVRVIPLLLDGAAMPVAAQLPDDLRALAGRNALELDNSRYAADIERLVSSVAEALGEPRAAPRQGATGFRLAVAAVLLGLGALALFWSLRSTPTGGPPASSASTPRAARATVNGTWQAALVYDWPNARYTERFVLGGDASGLHGSASFLGVPRGLLEGALDADTLHFVTRTRETGASGDVVHRYRARLVGDELHFVMQTEGGSSVHVPVEFVARRTPN